jgi:predicted metal-binding membrane protein
MKIAVQKARGATALATTLGLAAAAWIVTVRQMHGMDMGVATQLGSFAFFVALWAAMMAAMMLPGAVQAVLRRAEASGRVDVVLPFVAFGLYCVGSSVGLMAMLVALGVMSVPWMLVIAVLVLVQKLLPATAAIDVPLAVAIIAFGVWILISPASVPGLMPLM